VACERVAMAYGVALFHATALSSHEYFYDPALNYSFYGPAWNHSFYDFSLPFFFNMEKKIKLLSTIHQFWELRNSEYNLHSEMEM
jgi:hypothetical protein